MQAASQKAISASSLKLKPRLDESASLRTLHLPLSLFASADAAWITGETLVIAGGLR
jgi:hypothetical protein